MTFLHWAQVTEGNQVKLGMAGMDTLRKAQSLQCWFVVHGDGNSIVEMLSMS